MLSRNNRKEQFRKQEPKKQRFAIKKLTVGVASVLIGFTFMGVNAYAADNSSSENEPQTPAITGKTNSESDDPNVSSHSLVLTNSLQNPDEGSASTASSSDVSSKNEVAPSSEAVTPLQENEVQREANNVREVNNYADFIAALGNKDIDTIKLTGNIDGSIQIPNNSNSLKGYDRINNNGVAHTVTIDGQGLYGLNMGSRYIFLDNPTETNNDHWNITFENLKNIQTQNNKYGLLCIYAKDASKDSINFRNVNVTSDTTMLTGKNDGYGAVNVAFSGNNTIKGTLTGTNALVQARNLEINGTTTVTPTANNATSATAFSVTGNATVDAGAKLIITSTATNVAGITFKGNAGRQTIDNATAGVLRLQPNAQVTMD